MKLNIKSEFSLSLGLMLINHSNSFIPIYTVLQYCVILVTVSILNFVSIVHQ